MDSEGSLVDLLRARAATFPSRTAFEFDPEGAERSDPLTYGALDDRARAVAAVLRRNAPVGSRVVILCPPGPQFVVSFFGCLFAGMVAVPTQPPTTGRSGRTRLRLLSIVKDAEPRVILASAATARLVRPIVPDSPSTPRWIILDAVSAEAASDWREPDVESDAPVLLQYTSGSTSSPRGVVITQSNLAHTIASITRGLETDADDVHNVTWLPPYHDMGLIGGLLAAVSVGRTTTVLSPPAFLQRPLRWLEAIARTRATHSGGPNFAFELCIDRLSPERVAYLDLSAWRVAFVGAEPVRAETLHRFAELLAPCGFSKNALFPCYGLAEATLFVSGGPVGQGPVVRRYSGSLAVAEHAAPSRGTSGRALVSCGRAGTNVGIRIVDPHSNRICHRGQVGEIWLAGPAIGRGYFGDAGESDRTFGQPLAGERDLFLRTGDLGFEDDGMLFVTGRLKDVIIIRGVNHYPEDIERTVERCHPALQRHAGAAFSIDGDDEERLVVVHEVTRQGRRADLTETLRRIREAIVGQHDVDPIAIVLLPPGGLLKTPSGKIQRSACRESFLDGSLDPVASWQPEPSPPGPSSEVNRPTHGRPDADAIQTWLIARLAVLLDVSPKDLDAHRPFASLGLDSRRAVQLAGELEEWLGRPVPVTLAYEHPTIDAVAGALGGEPAHGELRRHQDAGEPAGAPEPIALIGIGCRFPKADGPSGYWGLLTGAVDAIGDVPADRWDADQFYDADPSTPGKTNSRQGGFLDGIDRFDPDFFRISPHEAARMDPQQRLLLEVAWAAIEDAGLRPDGLAGSPTGTFIGISTNDYGLMQWGDLDSIDGYAATGNALSIAANRLSYVLDLRGPSLAIDTACSSSLVAVHAACQSLRAGETSLALAGGANVMLSPGLAINFAKAGVTAPDGRCKAFDASANGYVRGEGAAVVVLKLLSHAVRDHDRVYAVIRGSAVNQDGRTNGLMAPSPEAQERVLRAAQKAAGVDPGSIQYVEAHGTGTFLGDPIEAQALGTVLSEGREPDRVCVIGSVKSNIGHLEAAAGVAGLVKTALAIQHAVIPPSLHFHRPNPHIPFVDLRLRVATAVEPWPRCDGPRRAGVSSFGFGGTNAHAVLEQAPGDTRQEALDSTRASAGPFVLPLSGHTPEARRAVARTYAALAHTSGADRPSLCDACFTASVRRTHHPYRLAAGGRSWADLAERLDAAAEEQGANGAARGLRRAGRSRLVFVFPGQGSQYAGMGGALIHHEPFRAAVEACDLAMRPHLTWSVVDAIESSDTAWEDIDVVQPILFSIQVGLVALWRFRGIEPDAVVGHSMGELAAAVAAGILPLDDAARVICRRSALLKPLTGTGGMLAVDRPPDVMSAMIARGKAGLTIGAFNSPVTTVLTGAPDALRAFQQHLQDSGIFSRLIAAQVGSHGPLVAPVQEALLRALDGMRPQPGHLPMMSSVTGTIAEGVELDAGYWWRNLSQPVRFQDATDALLRRGFDTFLEISPHPTLCAALHETLTERRVDGTVLPSCRREDPEGATLLNSLATLYERGHEIRWDSLFPTGGRCVSLPVYPWQRERCWFTPVAPGRPSAAPGASRRVLLTRRIESPDRPSTWQWELDVRAGTFGYIDQHRVQGRAMMPAAAFVEMVLEAATELFEARAVVLDDVRFVEPVIVEGQDARTLRIVVLRDGHERARFEIYGRGAHADQWSLHTDGRVRVAGADDANEHVAVTITDRIDLGALSRAAAPVDAATLYGALRARGLDYAKGLQRVDSLWRMGGEAVARLAPADDLRDELPRYVLHPALLDGALHVLAGLGALHGGGGTSGSREPGVGSRAGMEHTGVFLPVRIARLWVDRASAGSTRWSHARLRSGDTSSSSFTADVTLLEEGGRSTCHVTGLALQRAGLRARADRDWARALCRPVWKTQPLGLATGGQDVARDAAPWLILANAGCGVAARMTAMLEARDHAVLVLDLEGDCPPDSAFTGIVDLRALDTRSADLALEDTLTQTCCRVATLVQHLGPGRRSSATRLWLITHGSRFVRHGDPIDLAAAPLAGLARTIAIERRELACTCVDVDRLDQDETVAALVNELLAGSPETEVAYREGVRHVLRLREDAEWVEGTVAGGESMAYQGLEAPAGAFRLAFDSSGTLESARLERIEPRIVQPGEVEIDVECAGVNFKDLIGVMGLLGGERYEPGLECVGRVARVGDGVPDLALRDQVLAFAPSAFGTSVITDARLVFRKPERLSMEEAATIPVAFLTASYGLEHLARLRPGERILIHTASGGVGHAAIQLARQAQAEILATAGSDERRAYLRSIGINQVFDSRSLAFVDEVRRATGGRGVDVVLNSLSGQFLTGTLSVLAPYGRFVELGRESARHSSVELRQFATNASFFSVDVEGLARDRPDLVRVLMLDLLRRIDAGVIQPLPRQVTGIRHARRAFDRMLRARHLGKVVLSLRAPGQPVSRIRDDGTYLVTGGLRGLGVAVAQRLVDCGARHLVLAGRHQPVEEASAAIAAMRQLGADVRVAIADVAEPEQVADVLGIVHESMPPLRGVVHAAGILRDATVDRLTPEDFRAVLRPKALGAWNLHRLTEAAPLDFFVLFSSAAATLGAPGQGNYAAANAFLDGLAHTRRAAGQPAISVNWGPWADTGGAAERKRSRHLALSGIGWLPVARGLRILETLLDEHAPPQMVVVPADWLEVTNAIGWCPPSLSELLPASPDHANGVSAPAVLLRRTIAAAAGEARQALIASYLRDSLARLLGTAPSRLSIEDPLDRLGIDSLVAIQLKNRIERDLGLLVPVGAMMRGASVSDVANQLAALALTRESPLAAHEEADDEIERVLAEVEALPDAVAHGLVSGQGDAAHRSHD